MPPTTSPVTPRRVTRSCPGTPNDEVTNTPNTRKRARLDYARLYNSPLRNTLPTPAASLRNPAPIAQIPPHRRSRTSQPRL